MGKQGRSADAIDTIETLRLVFKSQYHATLAMLRAAIKRCPDGLWSRRSGHANPFWRIAYHTLYYTHLYLQPSARTFRPWEHHRRGIQRLKLSHKPPKAGHPYTQAEVLAYWTTCESMVDGAVDALDLRDPKSGFSSYQVSKLEHQIINIRHIQYHEAQLADRLRAATGAGVNWESMRKARARRGKAGGA